MNVKKTFLCSVSFCSRPVVKGVVLISRHATRAWTCFSIRASTMRFAILRSKSA